MNPPEFAWVATAGGVALVIVLDHRWRGHGVRSSAVRVPSYVLLGMLLGGVLLVLAGRRTGGEFLGGWVMACASVLDSAVVLAVLAAMAGRPSRSVLVCAVVLSAAARGVLPALVGNEPLFAAGTFALAGAMLVGLGWWLFRAAEGPRPAVARLPRKTALSLGCGFIVLFAWTSSGAISTVAPAAYLAFVANIAAVVILRPLFLLLHGLLAHGTWSQTGRAVLVAFTGTKLLFAALLPEHAVTSAKLAALSVIVVVAVLVASVVLPSLGAPPSTGSRLGGGGAGSTAGSEAG